MSNDEHERPEDIGEFLSQIMALTERRSVVQKSLGVRTVYIDLETRAHHIVPPLGE